MSFLGKIFNKGPKPIIAKSHEGNLDSLRANRAGPQSPGAVKARCFLCNCFCRVG